MVHKNKFLLAYAQKSLKLQLLLYPSFIFFSVCLFFLFCFVFNRSFSDPFLSFVYPRIVSHSTRESLQKLLNLVVCCIAHQVLARLAITTKKKNNKLIQRPRHNNARRQCHTQKTEYNRISAISDNKG